MKPYYEHGGVQIFHGDCREILPSIPRVSLILTDPPYGINVDTKRLSAGRNRLFGTRDFPAIVGDDKPFDPSHLLALGKVVLWGANHYADKLPASPSWIVWDKVDDLRSEREWGFADGGDVDMAWSNLGGPSRLIRHRWQGYFRDSEHRLHVHPTQKPVALFIPIIKHATTEGEMVLDPYCGSGPVVLAAKNLGRKAIGIEIEEHYCEVAAKRLGQEVFDFQEETHEQPNI